MLLHSLSTSCLLLFRFLLLPAPTRLNPFSAFSCSSWGCLLLLLRQLLLVPSLGACLSLPDDALRHSLQSAMDYISMGKYPYETSYITNGGGVLPPFPMRVRERKRANCNTTSDPPLPPPIPIWLCSPPPSLSLSLSLSPCICRLCSPLSPSPCPPPFPLPLSPSPIVSPTLLFH